MSDEESFVILGSTPTPSMEAYSSVNDIRNAEEVNKNKSSITTSTDSEASWLKNSSGSVGKADTSKLSIVSNADLAAKDSLQEPKLQIDGDASKASIAASALGMSPSLKSQPSLNESSLPETLADKFLLGKIDGNEMKMHVSSMFPSLLSTSSQQEDVHKLQQLIVDHETYKSQLMKMNKKLEYLVDVIQVGNEKYQQEIEKLRHEKNIMQKELQSEIEVIKIREQMLQNEYDSLLMKVSEGKSIMNNLGAKLDRLELQQQDMSIINFNPSPTPTKSTPIPIESDRSAQKIKEMERKLSEVTAENFELKDMKKIYIDEIDCLKVNLTAAEELLRQAQVDINFLKNRELVNAEKFSQYDIEKDKMKQEIEVLRQQLEVYRADFELERSAREELAGQKDQLLTDLKLLQRRNQQLIEENERRYQSSPQAPAPTASYSTPTRRSPPRQPLPPTNFVCPICNKTFASLPPLESHVQTCLTN